MCGLYSSDIVLVPKQLDNDQCATDNGYPVARRVSGRVRSSSGYWPDEERHRLRDRPLLGSRDGRCTAGPSKVRTVARFSDFVDLYHISIERMPLWSGRQAHKVDRKRITWFESSF